MKLKVLFFIEMLLSFANCHFLILCAADYITCKAGTAVTHLFGFLNISGIIYRDDNF